MVFHESGFFAIAKSWCTVYHDDSAIGIHYQNYLGEAMAALLKALRDNHERSHIFFNEFSFHKYASFLGRVWILADGCAVTLSTTCSPYMHSVPRDQ